MAEQDEKVSPRKALSRKLRYAVRLAQTMPDWPKLKRLEGSKRGKRCFLLGSGPSLQNFDLSKLASEDVCVVNMGVRALDAGLPHATVHVLVDKNRHERFGEEIEDFALRHPIPLRFFGTHSRSIWHRLKKHSATPFFLMSRREHVSEWGFRPTPFMGYGSCGTVAVVALQVLYYLGYDEVYVLGVDLDYSGPQTYFYEMKDKDKVHEADDKTKVRRPAMNNSNAEFAYMRESFERGGRKLANAGVGGNLTSLDRVPFETLFG